VRSLDEVFARLPHSSFRSRFRLGERDRVYLEARGLSIILAHAGDFIERRLVPAYPDNDGKQTPMRGHPAFVAQHATATCCRSCLSKWHDIPAGRRLSEADTAHVLLAIERWLRAELAKAKSA
jgi:bifunctional DNA-binding transcriptional regulator/antitoxin component of YhaV-PrlF toxin-antitoxin module